MQSMTIVLALMGLATLACAAGGAPTPDVGDPAPPFRLPGSDGRTHSLADHAGKRVVVLAWFPKAFTGG